MQVIDVSATSDPRWLHLVEARDSDVFHTPSWLQVLERTYGFELRALIVEDAGVPVAGAAYAVVDDLRGRRVVSVPFSDFCDPLFETPEQWSALAGAFQELGNDVRLRTLRADIPEDDAVFAETSRARWHAIEVGADADTMWSTIASSARRAIRKATTEGVTVRSGATKDDLRSFYELHMTTRKHKYGLLAQPYAFFENIGEEFLDSGRGNLILASLDDRDIAGVLFLDWGGTCYYKFNASDPSAVTVRPNDLILWTAIQQAIEDGTERIDLGLTDWDQEGLIRYKRKYAETEGKITFLRSRTAPEGRPPADEVLSTMTHLLTGASIPDEVTESAGTALYRYFA